MKTEQKNIEPVRAGFLKVGDILSYRDMANPYQEWEIVKIQKDELFEKIAVIKNLDDGYEQTCYSPISFEKDGYAGWKFVRAGQVPASDTIGDKK